MRRFASILTAAIASLMAAGAAAQVPVSEPAAPAAAESRTIKIATLAPAGSAWAKIMTAAGDKAAAATQGRVKLHFFFSGTQGDEREAVRKIKLGQIDGAAVTAVGLGLIRPNVRVLEVPFLIQNDRQLDFVRDKLKGTFEKEFDDAGYVLMAWGDVGWVHLYSNEKITTKQELNEKVTMWAWTDDPIVRKYFELMGVKSEPLGVPDVLPALAAGKINGCYGSPLAAVALQWYTKVKYASATPISYSIGAMVVRKDVFSLVSAADQAALRQIGQDVTMELIGTVRKDNERARKSMIKAGIEFVPVPAPLLTEMGDKAGLVQSEMIGKLYTKEILAQVKAALAEAPK